MFCFACAKKDTPSFGSIYRLFAVLFSLRNVHFKDGSFCLGLTQ